MVDKRNEYFDTSNYFQQLKIMRQNTYKIAGIPNPLTQQQIKNLSHKSKEYIQNLILETQSVIVFLEDLMANLDDQSTQWNMYNQLVGKFEKQEKDLRSEIGKNRAKKLLRDQLKREIETLRKYGDTEKNANLIKYMKNELKRVSKDVRGSDWNSIAEQLKDRWSPFRSKTWKNIKLAGKFIGNSDFRKFAIKRKASTVAKNLVGKVLLGGKRFDPEDDVLTAYQQFAALKENEASQVESIRTKNKAYYETDSSPLDEINGKKTPNTSIKQREEKARNNLRQMQVDNVKSSKEILTEADSNLASSLGKHLKKNDGSLKTLLKWLAAGGLVAAGIWAGTEVYKGWDKLSASISNIYNNIKGWWNDVKIGINNILSSVGIDFRLDTEDPEKFKNTYKNPNTATGSFLGDYYTGMNNKSYPKSESKMWDITSTDAHSLGQLSSKYEGNAGTVSSGKGDKGGVSFGKYQFASKVGGLYSFMEELKQTNPDLYAQLTANGAEYYKDKDANIQFQENWKRLAASNPEFEKVQDEVAKKKWYDPQAKKFKEMTGIDPNSNKAIANALWSASIQHSGSGVSKILENSGIKEGMSEEEILSRLYDSRSEYVKNLNLDPHWKEGILNRYVQEHSDAQEMNRQIKLGSTIKDVPTETKKDLSTMSDDEYFKEAIRQREAIANKKAEQLMARVNDKKTKEKLARGEKVEYTPSGVTTGVDFSDVTDEVSDVVPITSNPPSNTLSKVDAQPSKMSSKTSKSSSSSSSTKPKLDNNPIPIVLTGGGGMLNVLGINA